MDLLHTLDAEGKARIEATLRQQKAALDKSNGAEFFEHDEAMHRLFFELTGRLAIWDIVNQGKQHVDRARLLIVREVSASNHEAFADHLSITTALFNKDSATLGAALHHHFALIKESVLKYVNASHPLFIVD